MTNPHSAQQVNTTGEDEELPPEEIERRKQEQADKAAAQPGIDTLNLGVGILAFGGGSKITQGYYSVDGAVNAYNVLRQKIDPKIVTDAKYRDSVVSALKIAQKGDLPVLKFDREAVARATKTMEVVGAGHQKMMAFKTEAALLYLPFVQQIYDLSPSDAARVLEKAQKAVVGDFAKSMQEVVLEQGQVVFEENVAQELKQKDALILDDEIAEKTKKKVEQAKPKIEEYKKNNLVVMVGKIEEKQTKDAIAHISQQVEHIYNPVIPITAQQPSSGGLSSLAKQASPVPSSNPPSPSSANQPKTATPPTQTTATPSSSPLPTAPISSQVNKPKTSPKETKASSPPAPSPSGAKKVTSGTPAPTPLPWPTTPFRSKKPPLIVRVFGFKNEVIRGLREAKRLAFKPLVDLKNKIIKPFREAKEGLKKGLRKLFAPVLRIFNVIERIKDTIRKQIIDKIKNAILQKIRAKIIGLFIKQIIQQIIKVIRDLIAKLIAKLLVQLGFQAVANTVAPVVGGLIVAGGQLLLDLTWGVFKKFLAFAIPVTIALVFVFIILVNSGVQSNKPNSNNSGMPYDFRYRDLGWNNFENKFLKESVTSASGKENIWKNFEVTYLSTDNNLFTYNK